MSKIVKQDWKIGIFCNSSWIRLSVHVSEDIELKLHLADVKLSFYSWKNYKKGDFSVLFGDFRRSIIDKTNKASDLDGSDEISSLIEICQSVEKKTLECRKSVIR